MANTKQEGQERALPDLVKSFLEDRIQKRSLELPMLPHVANEVMALCNSDDTDAAKLSQVIHRDQALAGHVLRVSNSPAIRPQTPIISLQQAVSRLGMRQVTEIAFAISVKAKVFDSKAHIDVIHNQWRYAVAAGCFAKEVARQRRRNVESTFLCGLLHNVGKPVILHALGELEKKIGRPIPRPHVLLALEIYHTSVGGQLAQEWALPPQTVEAIRYHEDYKEAPTFAEIAMTVNLATCLAKLLIESDDDSWDADLEALQQLPVLEDLNLGPHDLQRLVDQTERIRETVEATL
ncbi:MAG: HDOD domain-containing protein [Planctomycetota bacterium]|jgi:HD-like signal output (HDOD) protein